MCIRILILAVLIFTFSAISAAQNEQSQTIFLDSADQLRSECDISARIDYAFIELNNLPTELRGQIYVIVYRGSEDFPAHRTNGYLQRQISRLKHPILFRKYDASKIVFVDGGFRKKSRLSVDFWLVPLGGIIPQPTETVEKPESAKNKAYLADGTYNSVIQSALFASLEAEKLAEEYEETEETEEIAQVEETESEDVETEEPKIDELSELYWGFSNYFGDALESDQNLRGTVIYYADGEEYDLKKSHELMKEFLENYKKRNNIDLERIRLIYGGYRNKPEIEYWIVPKGAKQPQPKPEVKKIEEQ